MSLLSLVEINLFSQKFLKGMAGSYDFRLAIPEGPDNRLDEKYVDSVLKALKNIDFFKGIVLSANTGRQYLLRLETKKGEDPHWAPLLVTSTYNRSEDPTSTIFVVAELLKEPLKTCHP